MSIPVLERKSDGVFPRNYTLGNTPRIILGSKTGAGEGRDRRSSCFYTVGCSDFMNTI